MVALLLTLSSATRMPQDSWDRDGSHTWCPFPQSTPLLRDVLCVFLPSALDIVKGFSRFAILLGLIADHIPQKSGVAVQTCAHPRPGEVEAEEPQVQIILGYA